MYRFVVQGNLCWLQWQLCAGTLFCLVRVGIGDEAPLAISWFYIVIKSSWKLLDMKSWLTPPPHCFEAISFPDVFFPILMRDSFRLHSMNVQWKNKILTFWLGENFRMVQTYIVVSIFRLLPGQNGQVRSIYRDTPSSGTTSSPSAFSRRSSRSSTSLLW